MFLLEDKYYRIPHDTEAQLKIESDCGNEFLFQTYIILRISCLRITMELDSGNINKQAESTLVKDH